MLKFNLSGTDVAVVDSFQSKSRLLMDALLEKMTVLMTDLQQRAASKVTGKVAESVRNPRAEIEGDRVVGRLNWGGVEVEALASGKVYDLAQIFEEGAKPHVINPVGKELIGDPRGRKGGTRSRKKGGGRVFGQDVLRFYSQRLGKEVFAMYLADESGHPGVKGIHFMAESIEEMRPKFREGMMETLEEWVAKKK